jgi:hypothetical protein
MKFLALFLPLALLSCADQQSSNPKISTDSNNLVQQLELVSADHLTVVGEDGKPVSGANILIGMKANDPFPGNTLVTDAKGQASVPLTWKSDLPITVQADGFITLTLPRKTPDGTTLHLQKRDGQNKIEIKGFTTEFGKIIDDDRKIDFGLVLQSFNRSQMMFFDLSSVLSPETDTIVAGKELQIPSNITLPKQHDYYKGLIPVTLNKPTYRSFVRNPGSVHLSASHGTFPLDNVVDDVRRGKSFFDMINYFTLETYGAIDLSVDGNVDNKDIAVNTKPLDSSFQVLAPQMTRDQVMLSLSLAANGDQLTPMDVKKADGGGSITLKYNAGEKNVFAFSALLNTTPSVVQIMTADDLLHPQEEDHRPMEVVPHAIQTNFEQLSLALLPMTAPNPTFMPLVAKPTLNGNSLTFEVPTMPAGLQAVATYVVYSDILAGKGTKVRAETRTRLWEMYTPGHVNQVPLPAIEFTKIPGHTYRWEVLFLARSQGFTEPIVDDQGGIILKDVTHITRTSLDVP